MSATTAADLTELTEPDLMQLHHLCLLELLRRYPPTWPTSPAYRMAARIFDATKELHQAIIQHIPTAVRSLSP